MDKKISDIPGMEGLFRHRDLPSFYRLPIDHPSTKFFMEETKAITRPVHALVKSRVGDVLSSSASLRQEGRRCIAWLDSKQVGSIIYVNFGSLVKLRPDQLFEFSHGLVNCDTQFIWVVWSDMLWGEQGEHMLCWPQLAEQQVTSIWIGEVWRIGIDMKDTCERSIVEEMIRRLMEEGDERKEILRSVERFSKLARVAISESGSSYDNLDKLIQDLRNL
ncbi:hypothetical protein ACFX15_032149 [Malus domestica]